jgi:hypothetical protein
LTVDFSGLTNDEKSGKQVSAKGRAIYELRDGKLTAKSGKNPVPGL